LNLALIVEPAAHVSVLAGPLGFPSAKGSTLSCAASIKSEWPGPFGFPRRGAYQFARRDGDSV